MPGNQKYLTCVYFIQSHASPHLVKIGESVRPKNRLKNLLIGSPVELSIIWYMRAHPLAETILHEAFADQRVRGEWFKPHDGLKAFVRRCKELDAKIMTPEIVADMLPLFATQPERIGRYSGVYRAIFGEEYSRYHRRRRHEVVQA